MKTCSFIRTTLVVVLNLMVYSGITNAQNVDFIIATQYKLNVTKNTNISVTFDISPIENQVSHRGFLMGIYTFNKGKKL